MSRARTTAFRAAAAVGVAGTLAFAVQSVGKDMTVQAHSDTPYKPTVDPSSGDSHTSSGATHHKHDSGTTKTPGNGDLAVSFSAKPKVLTTAGSSTGKKATGSVSKGHSASQSSSSSTPDPAPSSPQGGGQGSGSGSGQSTPPPSTQSPPSDSGSGSGDQGGGDSGGGLLGTVGGVLGGVTGLLGG